MTEETINFERVVRGQIEWQTASVFAGNDYRPIVATMLPCGGLPDTSVATRPRPRSRHRGRQCVTWARGSTGRSSSEAGRGTREQPVLQERIGSASDTLADWGVIGGWNGYTSAVRRRVNGVHLPARLRAGEELVDNLLATYKDLPEEIRANLPLRRT